MKALDTGKHMSLHMCTGRKTMFHSFQRKEINFLYGIKQFLMVKNLPCIEPIARRLWKYRD